jgi:hypothetical protein
MAEIVNLRQARKRKRRNESANAAAAKRIAHGRPAALSAHERLLREIEERKLEAHRLDRDPDR